MRDGKPVHNERRDACPMLDELPVPDLTLIVGHERMRSTPIMTSWGCPFACSFCSVTAMFGRKYRYRSAESVVAEIEQKRPRHIFFYDDNFAADVKRLKKLLRLMIERGVVIPWQSQVRTDVARDPELLDLMRRSGCQGRGPRAWSPWTRRPSTACTSRRRSRTSSPPSRRCTRTASAPTACSSWAGTPTTGRACARRCGSRSSTTSTPSCSTC